MRKGERQNIMDGEKHLDKVGKERKAKKRLERRGKTEEESYIELERERESGERRKAKKRLERRGKTEEERFQHFLEEHHPRAQAKPAASL